MKKVKVISRAHLNADIIFEWLPSCKLGEIPVTILYFTADHVIVSDEQGNMIVLNKEDFDKRKTLLSSK